AAIRLALNNPADVVAGGTRASYRVTRMNSLGNPTGGSSLIVSITSIPLSITSIPSQGLFYDALSGGQLISQVVIPQDSVGANFWFTSLVADEFRIQASSTGLTPAEDTIVVNAGAAKGIRIVAQDTAVVGDSVPLTGIIIDSLGNQTVLTNNIRVRLTTTDPTGIFIPDTIISVSAGSSTYSYLYRSLINGLQTITATWLIGGTNNPNPNRTAGSKSIYFLPGAAVSLDVLTEPSDSVLSGEVFAQQPVVVLRDAFGNRVEASGIAVAARVIPSAAVLSGDTIVLTNALGAAGYSGLALSGSTGTYRLVFTSSGLANDTSSEIYLLCPPTGSMVYAAICSPSSYTFNGQSLSTSGTYTATLTNAVGCDSVITLNLTVKQPSASTINRSICAPASFAFGGVNLTAGGTYTDTLLNAVGCDSVITLNLTVNQPTSTILNEFICSGGVYLFAGDSLGSTGVYRDTLTNAAGCDSIVVLNLNVGFPTRRFETVSICSPATYSFYGRVLSISGVYVDTVSGSAPGVCDTIVTLTLSVNGPSSYSFNAFRCLGGVYVFGGDSLFATGTYIDTLRGAASTGCDSIVTLNLLVSSPTYRFDTVAICSPATYAFNGQSLNASGLYLDTVSGNAPGVCDTIVNLILRVSSPSTSTITAQICANGSYLFNGRILRTAGTYTDTLTNAANCDSIVTLNLSIGALATASVSITICAPNSYAFDGRSLTATGVYIDTISGSSGACDTIVTLNLTVNQPSASTISQTICSPNTYSFDGQSLSVTGIYRDTLRNAAGCDSVITLNLTVVDVQITQEPSSSLSLVEGATGSLTVTATGATSYVWQILLSGTWMNVSNGSTYSGATTSTLGITAAMSLNGSQYRVVVTGLSGCSDTSQASTLTVTPALSRVIRIDALTACIGDTIEVPVEAEDFVGVSALSLVINYNGQSLSYQGYTSVGLNAGTLSVQGSTTGSQVRLGWFDVVSSQLGDGQLVKLRFAVTGSSALAFDTQTSGNCELADSLGGVITGVSFVSGSVTATGVTM
ncbi:MAG: cohesin domain-containing protein, partial [Bacteroidota bacterium]